MLNRDTHHEPAKGLVAIILGVGKTSCAKQNASVVVAHLSMGTAKVGI